MIPEFPQFKSLELEDKLDVEDVTRQYPPYSDFNFTSLWCWDIEGEIRLSMLNNNLVVQFRDYLSSEQFITFIGETSVSKTVNTLLTYSKWRCSSNTIRLIPDISLPSQLEDTFMVSEDEDNHDYIYSLSDMVELKGSNFRAHRNCINRFHRFYPTCETRNPQVKHRRIESMRLTITVLE